MTSTKTTNTIHEIAYNTMAHDIAFNAMSITKENARHYTLAINTISEFLEQIEDSKSVDIFADGKKVDHFGISDDANEMFEKIVQRAELSSDDDFWIEDVLDYGVMFDNIRIELNLN